MLSPEDALHLYRLAEANSIRLWISGGWGIDALLGEQTRSHKDLDVIMLLDDVTRLCQLLAGEGYRLKMLWSENQMAVDGGGNSVETAFVLGEPGGRELDVHAMTLDEAGRGIPAWREESLTFSAEDLSGQGVIGGGAVRCLSAASQVTCHTGYTLPEAHKADLLRLRERFGVALPF